MAKVSAAMLELTGICHRRCPSCLPHQLRTNRDLTIPDILLLAKQFQEVGIKEVTLCVYGSPAEYAELKTVVWLFGCRLKMFVNIVCRPEHLDNVWMHDAVFVSIDCLEDVKTLAAQRPDLHPGIFPFVMLSDRSAPDLPAIIEGLFKCHNATMVNVTHPMVLCDDPAHRAAIVGANKNLPANEVKLNEAIALLPEGRRKLVRYYGNNQFRTVCRFHGSSQTMIYIDANLKVRMCCHKPVSCPLGDLRTEKLADILAGPVAKFHENWQASPECQLCPEDGLAVES